MHHKAGLGLHSLTAHRGPAGLQDGVSALRTPSPGPPPQVGAEKESEALRGQASCRGRGAGPAPHHHPPSSFYLPVAGGSALRAQGS